MDKKPMRPNRNSNNMHRGVKNFGFVLILVLLVLIVMAAYSQPSTLKTIPLTQAISESNAGKYSTITVNGNELDITKKGQSTASLKTYSDPNASLKSEGFNYNKVTINYKPQSSSSSAWLTIAESVIPVLIVAGILFYMLRSAQGQGNQALSFGKSRARLYGNEKDKATFTDIAGSEEAKQDLSEVVEFLKYPKKFASLGARLP